MGKAAEALASLLVLLRMLDERRGARVGRELAVDACSHGILGSREGRIVARVGARIVAEYIAGKLVEYDRQRKAALCRIAPAMEFTARRTIIIVEKGTTDFRIEIRLDREP